MRARTGRRQHGIGGHDAVALRGDQRHAGVDESLLGIEHVERGALADAGILAHAVERDLGGIDLRLGGLELPPGLGHVRLHLVACLLGLPDGRVFGAALIERHGELGGDRGLQLLEHRDLLRRAKVLLHVADRGQRRDERALGAIARPIRAPRTCADCTPVLPLVLTAFRLSADTLGRECFRATPMEKLQSGGLLVP